MLIFIFSPRFFLFHKLNSLVNFSVHFTRHCITVLHSIDFEAVQYVTLKSHVFNLAPLKSQPESVGRTITVKIIEESVVHQYRHRVDTERNNQDKIQTKIENK